jgi:DNA-binding GntR family transcriptional regulator
MRNEFPTLSAPPRRTLSEYVADQLRQAIFLGQLQPGQRIIEREVAEAMQTSRGPVRDALKLLESERLIVQYPHKGASVALLSLRDAEEVYSLREVLEMLAVDYVIQRAGDEQLDELDEFVVSMAAQAQRDYTEFEATDIDLDFHRALCRISGHRQVLAAWEALAPQIQMLLLSHRTLQPTDFRERAVDYHHRLVHALRQRNRDLAHSLLREHIASSFQSVADSFKDQAEDMEPRQQE